LHSREGRAQAPPTERGLPVPGPAVAAVFLTGVLTLLGTLLAVRPDVAPDR